MSYNSMPLEFFKAIKTMTNDHNVPIVMASIVRPFSSTLTFNRNYETKWEGLQQMLRDVLSDSLFGNSLVGSDVCGGTKGPIGDEELCLRW